MTTIRVQIIIDDRHMRRLLPDDPQARLHIRDSHTPPQPADENGDAAENWDSEFAAHASVF